MRVNKPVFTELEHKLTDLADTDVIASLDEYNDARKCPLGKGYAPVRIATLGACSSLRRGGRALREGRMLGAARHYATAAGQFGGSLAAAPVLLPLAAILTDEDNPDGWSRSDEGVREHVLARRLKGLAQTLDTLRSPKHFVDGSATSGDLAGMADDAGATLKALELELRLCATPRLRASRFIATELAAAWGAHARFTQFAREYAHTLKKWCDAQPTLAKASLLGASSGAAQNAGIAKPVSRKAPGAPREILTLQKSKGGKCVEMLVSRDVLCAHSTYFERLYSGALGSPTPTGGAKIQVRDFVTAKRVLAGMQMHAVPEYSAGSFVPVYELFDMWQCDSMLKQWRSHLGGYIRDLGMHGAMRACANIPGSPLNQELVAYALAQHIPLTEAHFQQAYGATSSPDTHGIFARTKGGDTWLRATANADPTAYEFTLQWRIFKDADAYVSNTFEVQGMTFSLGLSGQNVRDLTLHLSRAPVPKTEINRLGTICEDGHRGVYGMQSVRVHGAINGESIDVTKDIGRVLGEDDELREELDATIPLGRYQLRWTSPGQPIYKLAPRQVLAHLVINSDVAA